MSTQLGFGPLERIDGPLPYPPNYSLLKCAELPGAGVRIIPPEEDPTVENGIERWMNGAEVYPYPITTGGVVDACTHGSDVSGTKTFGDEEAFTNPQFGAMTVYVPETCKTYKVWNQDEFKARAVAVMAAVESYQVASEFMRGLQLTLNPHLADGNGTFPNLNTATSVAYGLALLEAEIAKSGRLGLIHTSPLVATIIRERFAVDNRSGVIRTINGTVVVVDSGYTGGATPYGHAGATGTQEWMFASGPVDIRRTEVFTMPETVQQAVDRSMGASTGRPNTYTYRAERYYLVDWDTAVQAAVLVDPCMTTC